MVPCMVTGDLCNPVRTHGTGIKVAPGGLPGGVALVSSDKPAFGSYGFEKSLVSPMSEEAVEGYLRAINWLGDSGNDNYHYRTAEVAPRRGAWIETTSTWRKTDKATSRPAGARGLKHAQLRNC